MRISFLIHACAALALAVGSPALGSAQETPPPAPPAPAPVPSQSPAPAPAVEPAAEPAAPAPATPTEVAQPAPGQIPPAPAAAAPQDATAQAAPAPVPPPPPAAAGAPSVVQSGTPTETYVPPPPPSQPRERASFVMAWEMSFAMGELNDFVGDPSYRGWSVAAEWPVVAGLRIGGTFHSAFFNETKPRRTYETDGGAITGTLYDYLDVYTVGALARYRFLKPDARLRPFAGIEMGAAFLDAHRFIADIGVHETPNGFLFAAEAGGVAKVGEALILTLAVRYRLSTGDLNDALNPSYLSLQFGVGWEESFGR